VEVDVIITIGNDDAVELERSLIAANRIMGLGRLRVYPNPADDVLLLEAGVTIERMEVYNLAGQLLHQKNVISDPIALNVAALAEGVYLLRVVADSGQKTVRVVIAR
ncbi:MAG: T9SS type A sorting domain-containing protein, partial [Bacteroidota bacterium]